MSRAAWYWHRLRAMEPAEVIRRAARTFEPLRPPKPTTLKTARPFPAVSKRTIPFDGFKAFGRVPLPVDDPPRWNYDYLAGVEAPASGDYRHLPGADIKLIWELSRWYELARIAQAGMREKCIAWLEDWVAKNPPYHGWNWTSALESGIRLVHFAWIDAMLDLEHLRARIVPAHVHFTWRERSFGSSANNHLLGELAGLIGASVRWPELRSPSLDTLHREWEREVLAQFAQDGGNREQALNYHAFSLDLCQFACSALLAAGRPIAPEVAARLAAAEEFYACVQVPGERWDYGDSDDALVFGGREREPRLLPEDRWHYFAESGIARSRSGPWELRWDLSPLGYPKTAAHGHLDALHLSLWWNGMAILIDPGTGAYYADPNLRNALAGWGAHNGPQLPNQDYPKRLGPFLWSAHHEKPIWDAGVAQLTIAQCRFSRRVSPMNRGWQVEDSVEPYQPLVVRWQFPPEARLTRAGTSVWRLQRANNAFTIQIEGGEAQPGCTLVSPGFRQTAEAPFLELQSSAPVLRTAFAAA